MIYSCCDDPATRRRSSLRSDSGSLTGPPTGLPAISFQLPVPISRERPGKAHYFQWLTATRNGYRDPKISILPVNLADSREQTGSRSTASSASHFSFLYQYLIYLRRSRHFRALGRIGSSVEARQVSLTGCFRRIFAPSLCRAFSNLRLGVAPFRLSQTD